MVGLGARAIILDRGPAINARLGGGAAARPVGRVGHLWTGSAQFPIEQHLVRVW